VLAGVPTEGDPHVVEELAAAKASGVRIHTVFVGREHMKVPFTLGHMAASTMGMQFRAVITGDDIAIRRHTAYALPAPVSSSGGRQQMVSPTGFLSGYGAGRHQIGAHG